MIHAHPVLTQFSDAVINPIPLNKDSSEAVSDFCLYLLRHAMGTQVDISLNPATHSIQLEVQEAGFFPLRLLTGLLAFTLFSWLTLIGWIVLQFSDSHILHLSMAWGHDLVKVNYIERKNLLCEAFDNNRNLLTPYVNGTLPLPYPDFPRELLLGNYRSQHAAGDAQHEADMGFVAKEARVDFIEILSQTSNGIYALSLFDQIANSEDQDIKRAAVLETLFSAFGAANADPDHLRNIVLSLNQALSRYGEGRCRGMILYRNRTATAFKTHKAKIITKCHDIPKAAALGDFLKPLQSI